MSLRRVLAFSLMLLCAWRAAAGESVTLAGDRTKAGQVWETFQSWLAAYAKADLKGVMAIFDKDVRFSFQGVADQGYAELESSYVGDFKSRQPGSQWVPAVEEVYADGRLAFVRAVWKLQRRTPEGSLETKARNRSLDVLRLSEDGQWRILRSLNYPEKD